MNFQYAGFWAFFYVAILGIVIWNWTPSAGDPLGEQGNIEDTYLKVEKKLESMWPTSAVTSSRG